MKCDFCGTVFEINECRSGCAGCPMSKNCKKIKCPNCNYEMYPEPQFKALGSIKGVVKSLFGRKSEPYILNTEAEGNNNGDIPLTSLKTGIKANIINIKTDNIVKLRKLTAFGIMPGFDVILIQRYPAFVLQIGFTQVALDSDIASEIIVRT